MIDTDEYTARTLEPLTEGGWSGIRSLILPSIILSLTLVALLYLILWVTSGFAN